MQGACGVERGNSWLQNEARGAEQVSGEGDELERRKQERVLELAGSRDLSVAGFDQLEFPTGFNQASCVGFRATQDGCAKNALVTEDASLRHGVDATGVVASGEVKDLHSLP